LAENIWLLHWLAARVSFYEVCQTKSALIDATGARRVSNSGDLGRTRDFAIKRERFRRLPNDAREDKRSNRV
jgi:hypothetical protein